MPLVTNAKGLLKTYLNANVFHVQSTAVWGGEECVVLKQLAQGQQAHAGLAPVHVSACWRAAAHSLGAGSKTVGCCLSMWAVMELGW